MVYGNHGRGTCKFTQNDTVKYRYDEGKIGAAFPGIINESECKYNIYRVCPKMDNKTNLCPDGGCDNCDLTGIYENQLGAA